MRQGCYDYVRQTYGVPARSGGRVRFMDDKEGTILRKRGPQSHLAVRFDGEKRTAWLHPTWRVEYLAARAVETEGEPQR